MTDITPPEGYRFSAPIHVRYGDMDTLGHVNNAKYLTYCEQARVMYFREMAFWDGQASELGLIIAQVTLNYRAPVTLDDGLVTVWTRIARLGGKSFTVEHVLTCQRDGEAVVVADASTVIVVYDYHAAASVPIPDAWRECITAYEPGLGGAA